MEGTASAEDGTEAVNETQKPPLCGALARSDPMMIEEVELKEYTFFLFSREKPLSSSGQNFRVRFSIFTSGLVC